jgi:hypothetical protein
MPNEDDREAALRRIVEYAEQIGDTIRGEAEGQTGDGRPVEGYRIDHGGHDVLLTTAPGWEYFAVLYQVDLGQRLAVQRALDDRPGTVSGNVEIELGQGDLQAAVEELREHVEETDLAAVRAEFVRTVTGVYAKAGVDVGTDGDLIHRFDLTAKLFPYRESFDVAAFEAAVQQTVTAGWAGREFLIDAYGLSDLLDGGIAQPSGDGGRGMFQ